MAGVWIRTRKTKDGESRYLVEYRLGGRESNLRHGGRFKLKRLAKTRAGWIAGEIAARRVPDLGALQADAPRFPLLPAACDTWRASRVDVVEGTRTVHQVALDRVLATELRHKRLDEITVDHIVELVAELAAAGYKRETIKKSRDCLAMVLDHYELTPNPARDKRVKLPRERKAHVPPPLAAHVERVAETIPRHHVLPLLIVDECGPRVNELATAQVGDLDEHRRAIRVRWTVEKNDRYRHLELPDDLYEALLATVPPREDRDLEAPLFLDLTDARLRTAITKACKANRHTALLPTRAQTPTRIVALQAHRFACRCC